MSNASRLTAQDIREGVVSGSTLLVCAYDDETKFRNNNLEGAIPLAEFKARVLDLEKDTRIVFYCA